ncbi:MAG: hypothetical protein K2I78_02815, partial [Clostridia bacterium]|nr:hypothetical protein [Clostridia bacterium]
GELGTIGKLEILEDGITGGAGGIAGCMTDPDGECRNVVILGNNVVFNLTSDCFGDVSGIKYSGAVVADNTCGGTVDNVIVKFSPEYVESLSNRDFVSKNAAVHCGAVTNVTAIDTYEGGKNIRSVNCDCDSHKYSYCNAIYLDELTNVEYGINDNGEQVFEITSAKGYIESLSFNKYRIVNGGFTTDDSFYGDDLYNFDSHNFDIRWDKGKTFNISPYQSSGEYCWEIKASSWRAAEFEFADGKSITYTGKDVLFDFVKLKLIDEGYIDCDYTKFNLCNGDERIYDAVMVGEYDLTIKPIEKFGREFLYYDEQNRIMTPAPENRAQDVHKCFIAPTEIIFMQDVSDWTSKEFYFALKDAIDGAADGLVYSIDGNDPISENSLILHHIMDSSPDGSEYR